MFTVWSVKRGSDHPDRLHIITQLFQAGATSFQQAVVAAKCKPLVPCSAAQPTFQTTSTPFKILFFDISPAEEIPHEGSGGTNLERRVLPMPENEGRAMPNQTCCSAAPSFGKNRNCRHEGMKAVLSCAHSIKCCVSKFQGSNVNTQIRGL